VSLWAQVVVAKLAVVSLAWVLQWSCESTLLCPLAPPPASAVWDQVHVAILVVVEGSAAWHGFVFFRRCCMLATVLVVGVMIFFLLCVRVESLLHCVCDPHPPPPSSTSPCLHRVYFYVFVVME
jgi:hypothetical protein